MEAIFHRISVRQYLEKPVESVKIQQLLKAAMAAPSAGNQQPWEFYVVTDPEKLALLAEASPYAACTSKAPVAFVICTRQNCRFPEYVQIDASAATENLLLAADALGLGAVWLGIAPLKERMNKVEAILNIPKELNAFAIIPCGYPVQHHKQQDRYDPSRIHYVKA